MSLNRCHLFFAAAFAMAGAFGASADELNYTAKLDGASETPPNDSKGTGMVHAKYDTATRTLSWTIEYSGLTGPATAAHFHGPAPVGKAAGILVHPVGALDSPITGSAPISEDAAKTLSAGLMYFNIHTEAHKGGEIRGQLEKGM